jgi:hypothetical protein
MPEMKPSNRKLKRWTLGAVLTLLVTATLAWPLPNALKTILEKSTMKPMPAAKHFFEGPMLEVAQAIDAADAQKAYTLAKALGAERLNDFGNEGLTLLKYAGYKAVPETPQILLVVTALIKAGADPLLKSKESSNSGSILSVAALRARSAAGPAFLKAVLDGGVNPNVEEYYAAGEPYLFRFASQDTPDSLKLMVERGANVNARDVLGNSAIMEAIGVFAIDEVNYLLDRGADPKVVNNLGVSFAWKVYDKVLKQKDDPFKRYPKILALQERLIRAGVSWPPLSPKEMRKKLGIPEAEW